MNKYLYLLFTIFLINGNAFGQEAVKLWKINTEQGGILQLVVKGKNGKKKEFHAITGLNSLSYLAKRESKNRVYGDNFQEFFLKNFKEGIPFNKEKANYLPHIVYDRGEMKKFEENEFKRFVKTYINRRKKFEELKKEKGTTSLLLNYFYQHDVDINKLIWYLWDKGVYVLRLSTTTAYYKFHDYELFVEKFGIF